MDDQLKTTLLKLCQAIEQLSASATDAARHLVADARRQIAAASARARPQHAVLLSLHGRAGGRSRAGRSMTGRSGSARGVSARASSKRKPAARKARPAKSATPRKPALKRGPKKKAARGR